jgi:hypothetical protein
MELGRTSESSGWNPASRLGGPEPAFLIEEVFLCFIQSVLASSSADAVGPPVVRDGRLCLIHVRCYYSTFRYVLVIWSLSGNSGF